MLRIGHRGAAFHEPENTMRSFRRAVELGADMIELDVRLCGSGEIVILHDETVDRTTNGSGKVSDLSLRELKGLDAGSGERVPLLTEVLDEFRGKAGIDIELKGPGTAGPVSHLLAGYFQRGTWRPWDIILSSFKPEELFEAGELLVGVPLGFLFEDHPSMGSGFALEIGARYVLPRKDLVDGELVDIAGSAGLEVIAWTVNDRAEVRRLLDLEVHGIITDRPEILQP
ncbi:MAG: glycerophosphodiester phosphodiesterase [Thermoplasmatota archaeon]